jgi:tRNA-2-methylthio-N6-dimethylallyladenosine synthase
MERGYTVGEYLSKVSLFREQVPRGVLTSDIIIGFPGETDRDFEDTLRVIEEAKYDNIYQFKYSPRPGTPAIDMEGEVPEELKTERFDAVCRLQRSITEEAHEDLEGKVVEVMVEMAVAGNSDAGRDSGEGVSSPLQISSVPKRFTGRSRGNQRVQFLVEGTSQRPGDVVEVEILRGGVHVLEGISPVGAAIMRESAL